MFDFAGQVVLAVGGAGYLCSPACEGFASRGASLVVTDLDEGKAQTFARSLEEKYSVRAHGLRFDINNEDAIQGVVSQSVSQLGRLDVLVNAAYKGSHLKSLDEIKAEDFTSSAQVQLTSTFLLAREAADAMKRNGPEGGSMVFFSSMYGRISPEPAIYHAPMNPNPIDYGVTKAGLEQMIRYLAVHYASCNIRVNGVAPGAFPHATSVGFSEPGFQEFAERLARKAPMQRTGRQDELAGPVLFLASREASFVTGQTLVVDGGWTIW